MSAVALAPAASAASVAPAPAVARRLAASESYRLLRHPVMLLGFGLWIVPTSDAFIRGDILVVQASELLNALAFFPGIPALIAAHMVATRDRRAGTLDLLGTTPARAEERVRALCLATFAPAALALVLNTAQVAVLATTDSFAVTPSVWHVLQAPLAVLGACLLGTMVGVWAPTAVAPVITMVLMVAVHAAVAERTPAQLFAPVVFWADWGPYDGSIWFDWHPGSPAGHLVYVVGLCGMAAAAALVRVAERRRTVVVLGLCAVAVTVAGAILQLP
jgi:hypothetical protein